MLLEFSIFNTFYDKIIHGITTRQTGSFSEQSDNFGIRYALLKEECGAEPIFSNQMHGDDVIIVTEKPAEPFKGDAFITAKKGLALAVKVADCQGILIFDPKKSVIAAVHSGWRSSARDIIGKTVKTMSDMFDSSPLDMLVGISPSIGPCCADFSDPFNELPSFARPYIQNSKVDFWTLSCDQLKQAGVPAGHVEISRECTKCNPDKYFSHRNKDDGRMAVFIALR